jgi:aspartate ammonia-lyase
MVETSVPFRLAPIWVIGTGIPRSWADERRTIAGIVLEEGLLTEARLNELLHLEAMTRPSRIVMANATKPKSA